MILRPGNTQHQGARASQQDAFGFSDPYDIKLVAHGGMVAVVADGMGGMAHGSDASLAATHAFLDAYAAKAHAESIPQALRRALETANRAVLERAERAGVVGEMGTTLVAMALHDASYYLISVGDSAAYLLRRGRLYQLTAEHTHGEDLDHDAVRGNISEEEAALDPERHALTSFLGIESLEHVDASEDPRPLEPGDRVLICSDGLSKVLDESEIVASLAGDPQSAADRLLEQVLTQQRPDQDNVTALVVAFEDDGHLDQVTIHQPAALQAAPASERPRAGRSSRGPLLLIPIILLLLVIAWALTQITCTGEPTPSAVEGAQRGSQLGGGGAQDSAGTSEDTGGDAPADKSGPGEEKGDPAAGDDKGKTRNEAGKD